MNHITDNEIDGRKLPTSGDSYKVVSVKFCRKDIERIMRQQQMDHRPSLRNIIEVLVQESLEHRESLLQE